MIELVQAEPIHAAIMAELHAAATTAPWDAASFADFVKKPSVCALLAMDAGVPKGFILTQRAADEEEVLMIATHPTARRQGIGKALIVSIMERLSRENASALFLEVAEDNTPARALYESCGFVEIGRRQGYYVRDDGKVDALLLRHDLGNIC